MTQPRPAAVPAEAVWLPEQEVWQVAAVDDLGRRQGEARLFRSDGSLYKVVAYRDDAEDGAFSIFHPNGEVARTGRFVAGELDGEILAFASTGETHEALRGCCVPPGAWEMRARWTRGELHGERFFDRDGRPLLSDGSLRPERPQSVPADADYDEFTQRWCVAPAERGSGTTAAWTYFDGEGRLDEITDYQAGTKLRSRFFDRDGGERLVLHFSKDGRRHGPYRRRFLPGDESPHSTATQVQEEAGAFGADQPVGPWSLRHADGRTTTLDRGRAFTDAEADGSPALENVDRAPAAWRSLAGTLFTEGRAREALLAEARALGRGGDAGDLRATLARCAPLVTPIESDRLVNEVATATDEPISRALSALVLGGDAALLLRSIAAALRHSVRAARDLIEAAIRLAPDRPMSHLTRALVRLELGDPAGALADGERVAAESPESAEFVRAYVRLLFPPTWEFWPAAATPDGPADNMPDEPGQPLDRIRWAIQLYATRQEALRAAVGAWLSAPGEPAWLPPPLAHLLPDGPLPLREERGSIIDETEDGAETTEVQIDERIVSDGATVTTLMRTARANWAALTWLCWAAGLDQVALPRRLRPPATFASATGMMLTRFFRAKDVLVTNGLRSLTAGVPGFDWAGESIDALPKPFVEIAVDEYFELRALFLWLASPENLSPFQSDLRQL
jgi:hypothetical protein